MFENLTGEVGNANHQARLTQSRQPGRIAQTLDAANAPSKPARSRQYRKAIAARLIALAVRIAPAVQHQTVSASPTATTQ